jgi:DNA-binding response OmpR family regulator
MPSLSRILLVEDDARFIEIVSLFLERKGYRVIKAADGKVGLDLALRERPDLVVLDVELPTLTGFEICAELRRLHFESPILMLTSKAQIDDRVQGLEAGADDYLPKPFEEREFLARIRALLRRKRRTELQTLALKFGPVHVDLARKVATRDGKPLALTKTEFAILELLAKNAGQPVSRETLLDVVWGYARFPSTRTVDTHVWRLRKKIGDDGETPRWIKGVKGHGYTLESSAAIASA